MTYPAISIIDDNPVNMTLTRILLESEGHEIHAPAQ